MTTVLAPLLFAARHGRIFLMAGLAAGILLQDVAFAMKAFLPEIVALLLFLTALRIGPRNAVGAVRDLPATIGLILALQFAIPVVAILAMIGFGWIGHPIAMSLVLMLSASSISGSPNLVILAGHDPAPALRMLIIGTALLPLTVLAPLWLLPELGSAAEVLHASSRLMLVIAGAGIAAFLIRGLVLKHPSEDALRAMDGAAVVAMAIIVVGLMSAVGPALFHTPGRFVFWLAVASAANFTLQIATTTAMRALGRHDDSVAGGVVAGNRNIALFLVALPASVTNPLLLFIGCYQIPMYLTPIVLRRFYARSRNQGK